MVMTIIGGTKNFNVRGAHHVPKEDNQVCDILSRSVQGETWSSLVGRIVSQTVDVGLVDLHEDPVSGIDTLLELCDPRLWGCHENAFVEHWRRALSWVVSF